VQPTPPAASKNAKETAKIRRDLGIGVGLLVLILMPARRAAVAVQSKRHILQLGAQGESDPGG